MAENTPGERLIEAAKEARETIQGFTLQDHMRETANGLALMLVAFQSDPRIKTNIEKAKTQLFQAADLLDATEAHIKDKIKELGDLVHKRGNEIAYLRRRIKTLEVVLRPLMVIALDNLDEMNEETREECENDIEKARAVLAALNEERQRYGV